MPGGDSRSPWLSLLLARATFGYTPLEEARVHALGHDPWLAEQLEPDSIDDSALDARLAEWPWIAGGIQYGCKTPGFDPILMAKEYKGIRVLRAVGSRRQVFERVVEYWADHFSVYVGAFTRVYDDELVWRRHALGRFRDLLVAVIRSATMIFYLDNHTNVAGVANENLAREILELHTLGADGPYTEEDVREFARALTGWTFDAEPASAGVGGFLFEPTRHDCGAKTILGRSYPANGGPEEVVAVLEHLAGMPETADYVVRRMARWFLGDSPPEVVVASAKERWADTDGDLREVVREILSEAAIRLVHAAGTTKHRRPLEWLTCIYRGGGVSVPEPLKALLLTQRLGQAPFEWYPPDGYPDDRNSWLGLIEPRWVTASELVHGAPDAPSEITSNFLRSFARIPRPQWGARLDQHWTGGRLRGTDVREIQSYVDSFSAADKDEVVLAEALELTLTCPSFHEI